MIDDFDLDAFVTATLAEDLGSGGDVTSHAVIPADARLTAVMASRDDIVVAGLDIAAVFFGELDPAVEVERFVVDGDRVAPGTALLRVAGNARALLAAERSALNTVQHLSGIATLTRAYVDAIAGTGAIAARHAQDAARAARARKIRGDAAAAGPTTGCGSTTAC